MFVHIRRAVPTSLINTAFTYVKCHSKSTISSQASKVKGRNLKIDVERKWVQKNTIPNMLLNRKIKTIEDWKDVREDLFKSGKQITPVTVDSIILNYCINSRNYDLGHSYIEYLKQTDLKPNLATLGKYFRLLYVSNSGQIVTENEELDILKVYKDLRQTYKVLDASTCENVIQGLSITKSWEECLNLLNEIKITCNPSPTAYSIVAAAAFKNNKNDLAWKLLDEIASKDRIPRSIAYLTYLEQSEKFVSDKTGFLETLFEYLQLYDIKCDADVATKLVQICKTFKLNAQHTTITHRAVCQNCAQKLQKLELNENDFDNLKTAIFKNVIVGKNVFYRTTPDELQSFQDFIANMKKYDVVIDGLNVAYSVGPRQPPHVLSSLLRSVVKHFADQNKKILVLGRTHMRKWSQTNWTYITQNADTFLAQTLSQDDPYLLYCALNSGLNTIIVSKDLMRGHLFKLDDPRLKLMFRQWLTLNQYQLQYVNNQGKVFFKYPSAFSQTAQKVQSCWHVPYDELLSNGTTASKWLCINL